MPRKVTCVLLKTEADGLDYAPYPGELGKRIYDNVSKQEGEITWVNPACCNLTGYSRQEVLGQNPRLFKSGVQAPAVYEKMWKTILAGHVWHGELVNRHKDKHLYDEELTITPVLDGGGKVTQFVAIKQDITARKRAEEA